MKTRVSLRYPVSCCRIANLADIIKVATMLVKTTFKDSKNLKELEIMY